MIDGIKILDLSVSADTLLQHDRLLFALPVNENEGEVLTERSRRSSDRGLIFTLIPLSTGNRLRCELKGSLHRFYNNGLHNADDFTVVDLLAALDELISIYAIDPFLSRLNNLEFGVNLELPFPVSQVLENLISYKYRPFQKETEDGFSYHQCQTQRYVVKLYDKGQQYGLTNHVLRFEIKVLKMEYLTRRSIQLDCLADLLTTLNYGTLGTLLVETFSEILFDEPTINAGALSERERQVYLNGRNPRFWTIPENTPATDQQRIWKSYQRLEQRFRSLISKHRRGNDWQGLTAALIGETWQRLTVVDAKLMEAIEDQLSIWRQSSTCPLLTGLPKRETPILSSEKCPVLTGSEKGEMSSINPLDVVLKVDTHAIPVSTILTERETVETTAVLAQEEEVLKRSPSPASAPLQVKTEKGLLSLGSPRLTASALRQSPERLAELERGRRRYAKGSKEEAPDRAAHNLRNDETNPRNNLARRLRRLKQTPGLFPMEDVVRLTDEQRALLSPWQGTSWEVRLTV